MVEDEERDPFLIKFDKAEKRVKIIKCFGSKKVQVESEEYFEDLNKIIDHIPELDLPDRH